MLTFCSANAQTLYLVRSVNFCTGMVEPSSRLVTAGCCFSATGDTAHELECGWFLAGLWMEMASIPGCVGALLP